MYRGFYFEFCLLLFFALQNNKHLSRELYIEAQFTGKKKIQMARDYFIGLRRN